MKMVSKLTLNKEIQESQSTFDNTMKVLGKQLEKAEGEEQVRLAQKIVDVRDEFTSNMGKLLAKAEDYQYKAYKSYGRKRESMPQIDAEHMDTVLLHFQGKSPNAKVSKVTKKIKDLKPTQNEFNEDKITSMLGDKKLDLDDKYLISKDGFIVDGHHRWATALEVDPEKEVTAYKVSLGISELLRRTNLMKVSKKQDIEDKEIKKALVLHNFKELVGEKVEIFKAKDLTQDEIDKIEKKHQGETRKWAAAIVKNNDGEILFLKRAYHDDLAPGEYSLPGGNIDPGETADEAVARELKEETNLKTSHCYHLADVTVDEGTIAYYDCHVEDLSALALLDGESENYRWMSAKEWNKEDDYKLMLDLKSHLNYLEGKYGHPYDMAKGDDISEIELELIEKGMWTRPLSINEDRMIAEDRLIEQFDLTKGLDTSKLVAKKVQIQRKDGTVYWATRYVNQETQESFPLHSVSIDVGKDDSAIAQLVENPGLKKTEKIKGLINLGVYDRKQLIALTGAAYAQVMTTQNQVGLTTDVVNSLQSDNVIPSARANIDTGEVEYDTESSFSDVEQTIEALMEADGLDFDDTEVHKINPVTGKDAVDTVQDKFTDMIAKKQRKLAMFYGTGGVGKTYGVKKVLSDPETINGDTGEPFGNKLVEYDSDLSPSEEQYDYIKFTGKVTPSKLFRALYEHNGKIIMLDDADSVLLDEDSVNILKAATDTTLEDVVWDGGSIKGSDGESKLPTRFKFTGGVVVISNLSERKLKQVASPLLESRALSLDVSRTMEETVDKLDRIKDHLPFEDRDGEPIEVAATHKQAAIDFIKKYQNHMPVSQVNGRTLGALALLHMRGSYKNENQWFGDHAARSLMSVQKHQIIEFHKKRLAEEAKRKKEQKVLFNAIG